MFRILRISLDLEGMLDSVDAAVDDDTLREITTVLGAVAVTAKDHVFGETTVFLSSEQQDRLREEFGQRTVSDPRTVHTGEVYEWLFRVWEGLMELDGIRDRMADLERKAAAYDQLQKDNTRLRRENARLQKEARAAGQAEEG